MLTRVIQATFYALFVRSFFFYNLQSLEAYFSRDIYAQGVLQRSPENVSAFKLADQDR